MRILGLTIERTSTTDNRNKELLFIIKEVLKAVDDEKVTQQEIESLRKHSYNTLLKHGLDK